MTKTYLPILLLAAAIAAHADTLFLKDGRTLQGTYQGGSNRSIRFQPERGAAQYHRIADVDRVEFGTGSATASRPTSAASRPTPDGQYRSADGQYRSTEGSRTSDTNRANDGYRSGTNSAANGRMTIPQGTIVTVRLIDPINSDRNDVGETFRASLDEPLVVNGRTVASPGADAMVRISRVERGGVVTDSEEVAVTLHEITVDGRRHQVDSNYAEVAAKSRTKDSAKVIGGTAVVGAIIGAIAGGGKGAAIGAASGAGAGVAIQAIRGQRVQIPSETRLDFSLAQPITVR